MKNECSFVRDVMPLYWEGMVSEDTKEFVKEHLEKCAECTAELEALKAERKWETPYTEDAGQRKRDAGALITIKKNLRKKKWIAVSVTAGCLLALMLLLYFFPVYRMAQVGGTSYYYANEIAKLAYIGSASDRAEAQSVLRQADAAFHDCRHTDAENEEAYGLLARYATDSARGAAFTTYSLELWSAHLDGAKGYLWVYYSHEAFDAQGNTVCGSWKVPSLWTVEKDETGTWVVVHIKEHP